MADDVKQQIITTALAKLGDDGLPEDTYVQHLRIWEEDEGGSKARLVILTCKWPELFAWPVLTKYLLR